MIQRIRSNKRTATTSKVHHILRVWEMSIESLAILIAIYNISTI